jgi:hypothetical protein
MEGIGGIGGSKYHRRIPKVRLGKINLSIMGVLIVPGGGNRKGT